MLNVFRKYATSWLIKVALFLIVIVFIFWGGYSYKTRQQNQIASVDGHYISIADYNRTYNRMVDMYRRQLGGAFSEELLKQFNLKRQALELMVNGYLINKAAAELGLAATPQEIQSKILELPAFKADGVFDQQRYVFLLQQNHLTPEVFEEQVGNEITAQKVESFIKRRAVVSNDEILADLHFNFNPMQVGYVAFDPKVFEDQVAMDPQAIQEYFQANQERYKEPEKRQFAFVLFKPEDFLSAIQITPEEIQRYYEDHQENFHQPAQVRARHILFTVKQDAPAEEVAKVRAEAQKVLDEAKAGKDFAELANKYSQDPSLAGKGGDLGFFSREQMVPAFADAAFALKPGQVSDLVRTPYGFHIIKVEEVKPEKTLTLDEAKGQIETTLKQEKARDLAFQKARDFDDAAYAQKDVEKTAQAQKLTVSGIGSWVSQRSPIPGIDGMPSPQVMGKLFGLSDKDVSQVLELPQGFMIAQVMGIQPPQVPSFETVKDRVEKDFRAEKSRALAQQKASELLEAAKSAKSLDEAAKAKNLESKKSEWFSRREPDKELRLAGDALNKVLQLSEANPFPDAPLDAGNQVLVVQLLGTKSADDRLDKERDGIAKRLLQQKEAMLWESWLDGLRTAAQVKVFQEM